MQVEDEKARKWYEKETLEQTWDVRTLQQNIILYIFDIIIINKNRRLCSCFLIEQDLFYTEFRKFYENLLTVYNNTYKIE